MIRSIAFLAVKVANNSIETVTFSLEVFKRGVESRQREAGNA